MSIESDLRAQAMTLDGGCIWGPPHPPIGPLQLAHLRGKGSGGRDVNRIDSVAMLCEYHHDLLDGRTMLNRRREMAVLLIDYVAHKRHD